MKALVLTRYGGPEATELREVPMPEPGPGEALIRVHAAGLNPVDFKTRDGALKAIQRLRLPVVMGCELAGVVEKTGAGANGFKPGDRVFARVAKDGLGAFAEYAVVQQDLLAKVPEGLDLSTAAGIPLAGLTALQALRDEMRLEPGQSVFISGGAGGVGTFAIQIAKWLGARVATTASPWGRALVERLGADQVIDYTIERFQDRLSGMDGAFDLMGGETLDATFGVVKPGGMVVSVAGLPEPETARKDLNLGPLMTAAFWFVSRKLRALARRHGVRYRFVFMHPSGAELEELAGLVTAGRLDPIVDKVFPFAEIAAAMAYLEAGRAKGKVIVRMAE
ncbi:MAG: NADP-dependent oxidoreductase [Rhodobacterales bacterium]|nr:NADP-dependent oxidoreductase [Rhodobacterales bacterium]